MAEGEVTLRFGVQGQDVVQAAMQLLGASAEKLKSAFKGLATADVTKPLTDLGNAFKAGAQSAQGMGGAAQLLSGSLEAMATPLGAAAAGLGALATVMGKATQVAEAQFRTIRSLQSVTGTSVEETDALKDAFELMGLESDSMRTALFRLSAEMDQGGKRLAAFGIASRDAAGNMRPAGEVFEETVRKVGEIGDAAQRNAVLMQLFGRAGRELAPLFAQGGAALDEFKRKAEAMGGLTQQDYERTQQLIQAKAQLSKQMEVLWLDIAKVAIPVVETFVQIMGFLVEAVRAFGGLIAEWVKWMVTSKEAVDPLSLSVKALAASIMAVGAAIEYVRKFGKWVADIIAPPPGRGGAPGAPAAAPAAAGPIVTPDDVQFQAKQREEQLKVDQRFFQEQSALQTGSQVAGLKSMQDYLDQLLALERKKAADLTALTGDPLQKEKIARELALKEVAIEGEKRLLTLKIREQEAADAKRLLDEQLKNRRDAAAQELEVIQARRERDVRGAEQAELTTRELAQQREMFEVGAARDTAQVKQALIAEEVQRLQALAAEYQDNANLQREIQQRLIGLARERGQVELEEIRNVDRARADAAKAEEGRKQREAGMFGQMIQLAETYAKSQGRTVISQQDIAAASARMAETSQRQLATFFGGGAVDPRQLQEALRFTEQQRQMQKEGFTPESITSRAMVEAGKTYGAGFGYEAATAAFQRGDVAGGQLLMQRARIMEQAQAPQMPDIAQQLKVDIDPKIAELKKSLDTALNEVTDRWGELVATIPDKITRWLEAEAARN